MHHFGFKEVDKNSHLLVPILDYAVQHGRPLEVGLYSENPGVLELLALRPSCRPARCARIPLRCATWSICGSSTAANPGASCGKTGVRTGAPLKFDLHIEPPTWVLGDMVLARGHTGILFPSQANDNCTNVLVFLDQIKDDNTVDVNDPHGQLPRDQSSWIR